MLDQITLTQEIIEVLNKHKIDKFFCVLEHNKGKNIALIHSPHNDGPIELIEEITMHAMNEIASFKGATQVYEK